ncbi:hypothetical protein VPFG_00227 [Vibrio phage nt-1]|uniref:Uncharacterized protein n=1 Tax=Vibrio phage nt-1 TaxID=115992 RepID=A0A068J5Z7_9CAUD|nr:hypothetical protein VPFG_00227 [Vibrio phage nt-1]AIE13773.1 hypothetical protein VPFG_00227 [Vibrio phage nt-1]
MFNATEVLNQLTQSNNGQSRLVAMTGAKNLLQSEEKQFVSFKLPKAVRGINYVKITLNASDLYDVEFGKVSNKACPEMKKLGIKVMLPNYDVKTVVNDVYNDSLKACFERETTLLLSL